MSESEVPTGFWDRAVHAGIVASCEALYPANDLGAPDWRDTEMVPRTLVWLEALHPRQRGLIRLMFGAIELSAPVLGPALGRFSRLSPARRLAIVQRWRASWFLPLKWLGDGLKAALTMIYLSHPAPLRYMEYYKICARPDDPLQVEIRPNALREMGP